MQLQGTLDNADGRLRAGLFVKLTLRLPQTQTVLVVPATAIVYASYGNSIYTVHSAVDPASGAQSQVARQTFIRIGKRRGDFVSILEGLAPGDEVVSAGAFKLRNGTPLKIHNQLAPTPQLDPRPGHSSRRLAEPREPL